MEQDHLVWGSDQDEKEADVVPESAIKASPVLCFAENKVYLPEWWYRLPQP